MIFKIAVHDYINRFIKKIGLTVGRMKLYV